MTLHTVQVSAATRWLFVVMTQRDGRSGMGEASLNDGEEAVRDAASRLALRALSASPDQPAALAAGIVPSNLAESAALSAIDQALWDLHAQNAGMRLADAIGGVRRESILVYANINRRTRQRTPEGFAASARDALAAGFTALKIAPFDEVDPQECAAGRGVEAMQAGLARVAAVRAAAGPHTRLMVDCHWRFDEPTARALVDAAGALGVHWIECPVPETLDNIGALVRLRGAANARGVRLAGLELGIGIEAFRPWCEAGAYDVAMPATLRPWPAILIPIASSAAMIDAHAKESAMRAPVKIIGMQAGSSTVRSTRSRLAPNARAAFTRRRSTSSAA
jgi:galactonate dehydratase